MVINSFGSIFSNLTSLIFPRERTWHLLYWYQNILADRNQLCRKYVRFLLYNSQETMFLNSIFILKSIFVKKPRKWQQWSGHLIEIGNQGSLHTHYLCKSAIADPDDPHSMAPINPGSLPHPLRKPRITSFQSIVLYLRWSQSKDFASREITRLLLYF